MDILFKKWSGPLLLPRDSRKEETFCTLYRDRGMACAVRGRYMASMCWLYESQHHAPGRSSKRVSATEDKYSREVQACELFGYLCPKMMIMFCAKAELIIIHFFFSHFLSCPLALWFFGWRDCLWVYPSRESLEKEVESCLLHLLEC